MLGSLSLKKRWVVSSAKKCSARDRSTLGGGETRICFGHAELQILSFEDRKIKLREDFGTKIRELEIK